MFVHVLLYMNMNKSSSINRVFGKFSTIDSALSKSVSSSREHNKRTTWNVREPVCVSSRLFVGADSPAPRGMGSKPCKSDSAQTFHMQGSFFSEMSPLFLHAFHDDEIKHKDVKKAGHMVLP